MIVTEKQLLVLLQTTVESLRIGGDIWSFDDKTRRETVQLVTNQQNDVLTAKKENN